MSAEIGQAPNARVGGGFGSFIRRGGFRDDGAVGKNGGISLLLVSLVLLRDTREREEEEGRCATAQPQAGMTCYMDIWMHGWNAWISTRVEEEEEAERYLESVLLWFFVVFFYYLFYILFPFYHFFSLLFTSLPSHVRFYLPTYLPTS